MIQSDYVYQNLSLVDKSNLAKSSRTVFIAKQQSRTQFWLKSKFKSLNLTRTVDKFLTIRCCCNFKNILSNKSNDVIDCESSKSGLTKADLHEIENIKSQDSSDFSVIIRHVQNSVNEFSGTLANELRICLAILKNPECVTKTRVT